MWKQVMMGTTILFGGTLISRFFTFLYNAILIRELPVADYAIFSLLLSIFTWVLVFSHFDLYAALSKFVSEGIAEDRTGDELNYHYNAAAIATLLSLVGVILSFVYLLNISVSKPYAFLFFLGLVPMSLITVNDGLIKGHQNFVLSAIVDITGGASKFLFVGGFVFIYGFLRINDVLMLIFMANMFLFVSSFVAVNRLLPHSMSIRGRIDRKKWSRLFVYSKWVCITDLANTGMILALNIMVSFYSLDDLARFAVIILIYSIFQLSYGAITAVLIPTVATASINGGKIQPLGRKNWFYLFCATLLMSVVVYNFPYQKKILQVIFNKTHYSESFRYASLILIGLPFRIITMTNKGILQGLNYPEDAAKASLLTFLFMVIIMVPLYRALQIHGIILTLLLAYCLEYLLYNRATRRRLSYSMAR